MARSWSALPREILQSIFKIANESGTIEQCLFVCKGWLLPAQEEIYKKVELTSNQINFFVEAIEESPYQPGKYVQTIFFHEGENFPSITSLFLRFVDLCPNVREFRIDDMPANLWPQLLEALQMGKWKNLKLIPKPESVLNLEYYANIALKCNNLESITLLLWINLSEENEGQLNRLVKNLNTFKFLNHLDLQTFAVYPELSLIESALKIEDCSSLKSVNFYPAYPLIAMAIDGEREDTALICPTPNILSFQGYIILSIKSLKYIIHKFPGLNTLKLDMVVRNFFSLPLRQASSQKDTAIDEFLEFISKIEQFNIGFINIENPSNLITRYFNSSCNLHKKVKIHISTMCPSQTSMHPNISIKKTTKMYDLLSGEDIKMTGITVSTPRISEDNEDNGFFPRFQIARYIGSDVTVLHFSSPAYDSSKDDIHMIEENLEEALEHCSSLKTLILSNITIPYFEDAVPQSLETIIFNIETKSTMERFVKSWSFSYLMYISLFLNISKDEPSPNCYRFDMDLQCSRLKNVSFNANIHTSGIQSSNFSKLCLEILYTSGAPKDTFAIDSLGMRKAYEKEFDIFSDYSYKPESFDCCQITIICAGIKTFTCDTGLNLSYFPTTYILDSYK